MDAATQKDTGGGDCDDLLPDAIKIALDHGQASHLLCSAN